MIFLHLGRLWAASHNSCGSRPGHSRMLSMDICCGLPRFLPPLTVPCSISLASVLCLVVWPNHWSCRRFTVAKSGSCGPADSVMACITDVFVMWSGSF